MTNSRRTSRGPIRGRGPAVEKHWFKLSSQFFFNGPTALVGPGLHIFEITQSHSDTSFWISDRSVAKMPA